MVKLEEEARRASVEGFYLNSNNAILLETSAVPQPCFHVLKHPPYIKSTLLHQAGWSHVQSISTVPVLPIEHSVRKRLIGIIVMHRVGTVSSVSVPVPPVFPGGIPPVKVILVETVEVGLKVIKIIRHRFPPAAI